MPRRYDRIRRTSHSHAVAEQLEPRRLLSGTAQFTDTDGDLVTAQVTGNGTVQIFQATRFIWVSNTDVHSVLTVSVQKSATGDGIATMGELRIFDPIQTVDAPNINFTHEVTTNDDNLPVSATDKISMNLGQLINLGMWTGGQRIGSLTVADWTDLGSGGQLNAPSIDSFTVTGRAATGTSPALVGNSDEEMFIGDSTTSTSDYSIGYMQVAGHVGNIQATGQIGTLLAGSVNGTITASSIGRIRARATGGTNADGSIRGSITAGSMGIIRGRSTTVEYITATNGGISLVKFATDVVGLTVAAASNVQTVAIGGNISSSRIQTDGSIGAITFGTMDNTDIQIGVAESFSGIATTRSSFDNLSASLGAFTITGNGQAADLPMITGSNVISAPIVGTLNLRNPESRTALQVYLVSQTSPATIDVTGQLSSVFVWHSGQPEPRLVLRMLHYV